MKSYFYLLVVITLILPVALFAQSEKQQARAFVQALFEKNYNQALSYCDSSFTAKVTPAMLEQIATSLDQQVGAFQTVLSVHQKKEAAFQACYVYCRFEKDSLDIKLVFNNLKKVAGLFIVPHAKTEDGKTDKATDYSVLSGDLTLPGTLLIPKENNRHQLVIFVHGSGPGDRNETLGPNKPFQDLAEGLLAKGIASFRYDKRTLIAGSALPANFTVDDEVTTDVLNIIRHFKEDDRLKDYKIYVIGHSLGGMMAPRIAKKAGKLLSGVILMAAPARPIEDLLLEQMTYLDSLQPSEQMKNMLAETQRQVDYMHGPSFSRKSPKDSLPLHQGATYWQSLMEYQPLEVILQVHIPIFILQGEKDFQVRMTDFNLWKEATKGMQNVSFKSFPGLSHLFMEAGDVPGPQDYGAAKHIPVNVMDVLVEWITKH